MDWFGRAKISFTHHTSPLTLQQKDGTTTDLLKVCEQATPPCQLNPLLFNGHVQTMWTVVKEHGPQIYYRRKIFDSDHKLYAGTFTVDFVTEPHQDFEEKLPPRTAYFSEQDFANLPSDDSKPMLIVLHGLSGGSHEIYLRHAILPLVESGKWEICVVNSRGCANSAVTSGLFFNARATWDIRQVVKWARQNFPNRPLFGVGFSLGANILTNYVGEEGEGCLLKGAVAVGNPFNLDVTNRALRRTHLGRLYQRVMGTNMKKLVANHKETVLKYTNLDYDRIQNITYLNEFDREVQTVTWGYPTEDAYYRDASSCDAVLGIRIPFMALSAADDPIAVEEAIPYQEIKQNPYTVLCLTSLGGHLSWFELGGGRWHTRPICNFLNKMAFDIDLDAIKPDACDKFDSQFRTHFDPVQRKLQILDVDQ
ncbi:AB-hydrolase YheT [Neurospora crassa]|uniref:alcohol O-acetyltransferase n=1 Tax=Neurospora crassa (strain ATCC 24698 / 74-OR23-1A / CBS 708.71 / DSM 1257 / FGSC 987) TaxID=367110 RepID=Q1K7W3_NEUCR|nr:hydrolase [Neurospora crassa OR74A]EAA32152.2 hydrolase [Neurospora crassa OR74A]KHE83511.1 AB-hydrolase YheT [Neurospora crassa]|eukprot:XP_961388.2 hydrolase [Neurospora crassa OR74A]